MAVLERQDIGQTALPLGRKVPRGNLRWYLATCPEGSEQSTCNKLLRAVSREFLEDAFVLCRERTGKFKGVWVTDVVNMFKGYFVVVTRDVLGLAKAVGRLTFPVHLAGSAQSGYAPVGRDTQSFLESTMDERHVVCMSQGEFVSDALHVTGGPLVGQESRVVKVVRKKAFAQVRVGGGRGEDATLLTMPLAILARR